MEAVRAPAMNKGLFLTPSGYCVLAGLMLWNWFLTGRAPSEPPTGLIFLLSRAAATTYFFEPHG